MKIQRKSAQKQATESQKTNLSEESNKNDQHVNNDENPDADDGLGGHTFRKPKDSKTTVGSFSTKRKRVATPADANDAKKQKEKSNKPKNKEEQSGGKLSFDFDD